MSEVPSPIMFDRSRVQRPHRKSRLGCKVCKARKIKCDEVRPVCGNCYRRFPNAEAECEFDYASPQIGRSTGSAAGSSQDTLAPSIQSVPGSRFSNSRSMELRLFHHFSTVTCLTMPTCEEPAGLNMWKVTIPSLAFEYPYIYSAILGIAAIHLLTLNPTDITLKAASYQYIGETVSGHREEIRISSDHNSLKRLTTSVLITMHAKLRTRCEVNSGVPYTLPINYFILQNGASDLWLQKSDWGSEIKAYINCYSHLAPLREPYRPPEFHHYTYVDQDFLYDPLPGFIESENSIIPIRKGIYTQALTYISLIKECILLGEKPSWIQNRIAIVACVLGKGFCALLQEADPIAMVILARLFVLLKFVDDPWWLQGTAEYEVRGLETLVPEEWKWGMEWPLEILENSMVSTRDEE